jgi:hypothetical protein
VSMEAHRCRAGKSTCLPIWDKLSLMAEDVMARPDSQRLERVNAKGSQSFTMTCSSLHRRHQYPETQEASIPRECNGKALRENLALSRFFIV